MTPIHLTLPPMAFALLALNAAVASAEDDKMPAQLGGLTLLEGYEHVPLQGIDSVVGKIAAPHKPEITYEIGRIPKPGGFRLGGDFSDRPKQMPAAQRQWYKEQTIGDEPVHLALTKKNRLAVSYPKRGINFSVTIRNHEDLTEALLILLSVPNKPPATDSPKSKSK
jgi:hypothetical protein